MQNHTINDNSIHKLFSINNDISCITFFIKTMWKISFLILEKRLQEIKFLRCFHYEIKLHSVIRWQIILYVKFYLFNIIEKE